MRTVKFITLGCKVNQYDTQAIRERFANSGFKEIFNGGKADVYLINTCTVTSSADRKSRHAVHSCYRKNPKARIIVTGCYAQLDTDEIAKIPGVTDIIKNRDKYKIAELLSGRGMPGKAAADNDYSGISISSFSGHTRAFIKIQDGCDNFCSYCKVPLVRGSSRSRPLNEIFNEALRVTGNGFKEIVLCGICLGSYGKDSQEKGDLVEVIDALEKIDGLLRIRLSSIEGRDISDDLIGKMAESKKLCPHLHIPIQSGDDEILRKMNRNYSRRDYISLVSKIKRRVPAIAITTDVMVGFPGEREDNFKNTVDLIREVIPSRVHIFPYSRRLGTQAAMLQEKTCAESVRERLRLLSLVSGECARIYRERFLDKDRAVLIEGRSKENNKYWEGYTDNYIKVRVKSRKGLKNQLIRPRLKKIKKDYIEAVLL